MNLFLYGMIAGQLLAMGLERLGRWLERRGG